MFEPGVVNRENSPATAWFAVGAYDDATRGREQEVWDALHHAGTVEISDDIRSSKWMKLVANAGELVPSAILDLPLADAAGRARGARVHGPLLPGGRGRHDRVRQQARPVFGLTEDRRHRRREYAPALLDIVLQKFSSPTTRTTVLQDWMKGRRAEVQEINGTVVRAMRAAGLQAPANERTVEIALRIEAGELTADPRNAELLLEAPVSA